MLKPKDFAEKIGVTVKTLQNWDNNGILKAQRTPTNRRCYTEKNKHLLYTNQYNLGGLSSVYCESNRQIVQQVVPVFFE